MKTEGHFAFWNMKEKRKNMTQTECKGWGHMRILRRKASPDHQEGRLIECAPGVRHWHGAAPDSWFSQMVVYEMKIA